MKKETILRKQLRYLTRRSEQAYQEGDDERFIKLVNCICKVLETGEKLNSAEGGEVRLHLIGDPGEEVTE